MNLSSYLENKPLFYKKIDFDRFPRAYKSVKHALNLGDIIHIVGSNGKGSTGRFLAQILELYGYEVGHFTSPHLFEFKERFYTNSSIVSDEDLDRAHDTLQALLSDEFKESLSYFEYATLLAAVLFQKCEYVIFEAGMGGEFDSTNQFDKRLSLFTPISMDHIDILGDTLEKISITKLNAMSNLAILNDDMSKIPTKIAKDIAKQKGSQLSFASDNLTNKDKEQIYRYSDKFNLPNFLISNLTLACAGFKALNLELDLSELKKLNLRGRCERIAPNLTIDVGHNEDGARAILREFKDQKVVLIYNSFKDKDFFKILEILKPIVEEVQIYHYKSSYRELASDEISKVCALLGIKCSNFTALSKMKNYLVFGSFMLVQEFLENENLS
ncbi:MAG: bifunctional folylpolyglutamate synthase/dihydrofolate synthase [Campylobacter sp.]|nr:bifunctional folylpolyglutamate synthase/dihydrofolate synthase [Campylobacter sp.]